MPNKDKPEPGRLVTKFQINGETVPEPEQRGETPPMACVGSKWVDAQGVIRQLSMSNEWEVIGKADDVATRIGRSEQRGETGEERARTVATSIGEFSIPMKVAAMGGSCLTETWLRDAAKLIAAAIRDAEKRAVAGEQERCCNGVCQYCNGDDPDYRRVPTLIHHGVTAHLPVSGNLEWMPCAAAAIRKAPSDG